MYAADCKLYEVCLHGRNEASVRRRIVLKSSRCHLGKMRSAGSGVRHCSPWTWEFTEVPVGVFTP
jgi:hypothetical protein